MFQSYVIMVTCPHLSIKGEPGHRDVLWSPMDVKVFTARVGQHVTAVVALETVDETGCQDTGQVRIFAVCFLYIRRHRTVNLFVCLFGWLVWFCYITFIESFYVFSQPYGKLCV